ncbi:MAG: dodecin family protein [Promethearchaeota archaeon]|jgi:flavin-binding protein dodecin
MPVYKSIQLVATSEKNWADAVKAGYEEAKKTLRGIRNIEIIKSDVKVKEDVDKLIY